MTSADSLLVLVERSDTGAKRSEAIVSVEHDLAGTVTTYRMPNARRTVYLSSSSTHMTHVRNQDLTPPAPPAPTVTPAAPSTAATLTQAQEIEQLKRQLADKERENAHQAREIEQLKAQLAAVAEKSSCEAQTDDNAKDRPQPDDREKAERQAMEMAERESVKAERCAKAMAELKALEQDLLDAKTEAAEALADSKAEFNIRTSGNVENILGIPSSKPDRKEEFDGCIAAHRKFSLKVKAAEHALSAARKRHLHNEAMHTAAEGRATKPPPARTSSLEFIDTSWRSVKHIVLRAVEDNAEALQYASEELRDDKDVALTAVASDCRALRFLNPALRNDEDVILASFKRKPSKTIRKSVGVQCEEAPSPQQESAQSRSNDETHDGVTPGQACARRHGDIEAPAVEELPPKKRRKAKLDAEAADTEATVVEPSAPGADAAAAPGAARRMYRGQETGLKIRNGAAERLRGILSATDGVLVKQVFDGILTDDERTAFDQLEKFSAFLSLKNDWFQVETKRAHDTADKRTVRLRASNLIQSGVPSANRQSEQRSARLFLCSLVIRSRHATLRLCVLALAFFTNRFLSHVRRAEALGHQH